jgi:hypothetical protein
MKSKDKIGILVVLGGIALIGAYLFKINKPSVASSQSKALQKLSDFYKSGGGKEETFIKGQTAYNPLHTDEISLGGVISPYYVGLDLRNLTPKQIQDIKTTTSGIGDVQTSISNQITQNMQSADFSNLSSLGLANIDWSNIKIK